MIIDDILLLMNFQSNSKIDELVTAQERLVRFAKKEEMNVVVVLMPESSRSSKSSSKPYGSYERASQIAMDRRKVAEEPMAEGSASSSSIPEFRNKKVKSSNTNTTYSPITGIPPLCHTSLDACVASTNNCSGHGECYKKYSKGSDTKGSCYACGCRATNESMTYANGTKHVWTIAQWGGAACHKKDVSGPFWLITVFTVVLVGLLSWGIGLLFSIGEEKLPGVIGAGVSNNKAR